MTLRPLGILALALLGLGGCVLPEPEPEPEAADAAVADPADAGTPVLTWLTVEPAYFTVPPGTAKQLEVRAHYSDKSWKVATEGVAFLSSNPSAATVDASGLVRGLAVGATTIEAKYTEGEVTQRQYATLRVTEPVPFTGRIKLPRTGQAASLAAGDDGALQKGVAWPSPRFTNPDGTAPVSGPLIVDSLTGLMWLRVEAAATELEYLEARTYVAGLATRSHLGYSDWRLPTIYELRSLMNYAEPSNAEALAAQGFGAICGLAFSSSGLVSQAGKSGWAFNFHSGSIEGAPVRGVVGYALAVRATEAVPGAPADVPKTGQTQCTTPDFYDELDCAQAWEGAGMAWPDPRFANLDGSTPLAEALVVDLLTGLTWPRAVDATGPEACAVNGPTMTWEEALAYVGCLNAIGHLGASDWRLPNVNELMSVTRTYPPSLMQLGLQLRSSEDFNRRHWSSTTVAGTPGQAWAAQVFGGYSAATAKTERLDVWPVRGGP